MEIILAQPRGFCAGVVRAIESVERALTHYGAPVYVYHEIVHNRHVVNGLRQRGAVFVERIAEVPEGAVCIFSAHGVSSQGVEAAKNRQLHVIDATCPLVTKVHQQAQRYQRLGFEVIIIGHRGHPEVEGTRGCIAEPAYVLSTAEEVAHLQVNTPDKLAYVTQTTLSLDDTREVIAALQNRFPNIQGPTVNDICYATQNRQNAARELAKQVEVLLVVGAHNSSNSNRLRETGEQMGIAAYLIENAADIQVSWLHGKKRIGITAGASAPEVLVEDVLNYLAALNKTPVKIRALEGKPETISFKLPQTLIKPDFKIQ